MRIHSQVIRVLAGVAYVVVLFMCGCKPNPKLNSNAAINPTGVFAQLLRIDTQNKSDQFEKLMAELSKVADSANLPNPYHWICYRETSDYYWLLTISDSVDNFKYSGNIYDFAATLSDFAPPEKREEILVFGEVLKDLPVVQNVTQQFAAWSTTNNVESRDYPYSRVVIYHVKESEILEFHENMSKLIDFLERNKTTLQVEGFLAEPTTSNIAWQVIFLPRNTSFEDIHLNYKFSNGLPPHLKVELTSILGKIKVNTHKIQFIDGRRVDKLSYGTQ